MSSSALRVASVRRRAAATVIDVLLLLPVIGVIVWVYVSYVQRPDPEPGGPRLPDPSRRWQVLFSLLRVATVVRWRNSRSLGFRILRLRRVDSASGGPVSLRSALIRAAFSLGLRALISRGRPRVSDERPGGAGSQAFARAVLVLVAHAAPAIRPPLHQTAVDRLAGTVVVED